MEQALGQLTDILKWYIEVEGPGALGQAFAERQERKPDQPKPAAQPPAGSESPIAIVPKGLRSFDAGDSDFFLRKAIGWALRDYARTDPAWVRSFAETHELSPLSRREALKHLSSGPGLVF